jgi:hypothetical protein
MFLMVWCTASWRIQWLAYFVNFPLNSEIPKFPLQKGHAEVAALTTGIEEMLYVD